MFIEVLPPGGNASLALLGEIASGFYLAGGTGLALQLGHRISGDLDFFCPEEFEPWSLKDRLAAAGQFAVASEARGTLHGIFNSAKVSFLKYSYPLLFPTKNLTGIEIADYREIALMKITAISSRGSKKDFVDLYFVCQEYSLILLMDLFEEKYRKASYSKYHILKSLTFFEDADAEPDPVMLKPWSWENVKDYFKINAIKAAKEWP
ncbi:MAG: nucleotidyl transferase AbiEii/AbiGii toxin family protein [Firmicutes bacterium]|nr:nucleotidyl transferase AbiEii/AbiGii toxin family protein [Bacillota bacterium]